MRRKMAFHYVLAGHRMSKIGQHELAMECYKRAQPEYRSKRWDFAEVSFRTISVDSVRQLCSYVFVKFLK